MYCGNHRKFPMIRVAHGDKTCGHEGCNRPADIGYMTQNGVIERLCSIHKVSTMVTSTRIDQCKRPGCSNIPSYGLKEGPLSFCSSHKRVGMFTNRDGTLLVATRDGDAFSSSNDTVPSAKGATPVKVTTSVKGATYPEASSRKPFSTRLSNPALSTSSTSEEANKIVSRPSSKKGPRLKILHRASSSDMASGNNVAVEQHAGESSGRGGGGSGGGRRSRDPSWKVLEASGLIEGEEPQLITKEIREANAKLKKELREQRRKRREVGLRIGLVLETVAEGASEGADSNRGSGGRPGGSSSVEVGNVRDKRAMADDAESIGTISSEKKRRKASTPEVEPIPRAEPSSSTKDSSSAASSDVQESHRISSNMN